MTSSPVDTAPNSEELRAAVHQLVNALVQIARNEHGSGLCATRSGTYLGIDHKKHVFLPVKPAA